MMGRTPGPWRVEVDTTLVWGACVINDGAPDHLGYPVADAQLARAWRSDGLPTVDEAIANANLIAAAPELLDALQQAIDDFQTGHSVCEFTKQMMIAAIAKAEAA